MQPRFPTFPFSRRSATGGASATTTRTRRSRTGRSRRSSRPPGFASCQGNINATEAIVVQKETCDLWDEIEECVSGFNVQMINQSSHLIFWLTNLNAWYGRANDGLSTPRPLRRAHQVPRLELRVHDDADGPAPHELPDRAHRERCCASRPARPSAQATLAASALGRRQHASSPSAASRAASRRRSASRRTSSSPGRTSSATRSRTRKAGGQRPRLKFEKLFHKDAYGTPLPCRPGRRRGRSKAKGLHPGAGAAAGPHRGDRRARRRSSAATRASSPGPRRRSAA